MAIIVGVVVGVIIGYVIALGKNKDTQGGIEKLQWQLEMEKQNARLAQANLEGFLENTKADCERRVVEVKNDAEKRVVDMLAAQEKRHELAMRAQQELFDETMARVTMQVKSATDDMLRQRQKEFAESSNSNLGQIVNPLRETIEKMKQAMDDGVLKQTELRTEMKVGLENMMKHSEAARQSADELARVFKHKSKVQGDWGECVLDELLEAQGLTQGIHYETQATIRDASGNVVKTDAGSSLRPDLIMHIDNKRDVVIDSKVSLTAFWDYINTDNEDERRRYLKAHIESIQKHVKELSKKDYSSYIKAPKVRMDYVIMFVPHTGALWTALDAQPDIWRKAMEMDVFIADEQTLFAALKIIKLTWTHVAQTENHKVVYELANEIIERVGMFMKSYEGIGKAIADAQKAYDDGSKKLAPKGQSILTTCAKLTQLGARQSSRYPIRQIENVVDVE